MALILNETAVRLMGFESSEAAIGQQVDYWGIQQWLNTFAQRIPLHALLFLAPLVIIIVITTLTINSHIVKAATADPVNAFKHE